jgi:hypothetical protein
VAEQVQVEGGDPRPCGVGRRVAVHRGAVEPGAVAAVLEEPVAEADRGAEQHAGEIDQP